MLVGFSPRVSYSAQSNNSAYKNNYQQNFGQFNEDMVRKIVDNPDIADTDYLFLLLAKGKSLAIEYIDTLIEASSRLNGKFGLLDTVKWAKKEYNV